HLAGARLVSAAATDETGFAHRVVWRAKGSIAAKARTSQETSEAVNSGHLERFLVRERREDRRQSPREHGLSRAWRTDEQQVVRAGSRDLQRAPRRGLAANVRDIVEPARLHGWQCRTRARMILVVPKRDNQLFERGNRANIDA